MNGLRRGSGVLDADLTAGLAEGIEHGFLSERDGAVGFRHELDRRARSNATCSRWRGPATTRPWRRARRISRPRLHGTGWGARRRRRPRGRDRGRRDRRGHAACRRRRAGGARAGAVVSDRVKGYDRNKRRSERPAPPRLGPRRPPGAGGGGGVRDRPDLARDRLPRGRRSVASTPGGTASGVGLSYDRLGADPARRRGPGRRHAPPRGGRWSSSRASPARNGPRSSRRSRSCTCSTASSRDGAAGRPRGDQGRARLRSRRPATRRSTRRRRSAVALAWGSDPNAAIELLREAEAAAREIEDPRCAVPRHRQPDDRPRPRRSAGGGGRRRLSRDRGRAAGRVSRPSTATSWRATSSSR